MSILYFDVFEGKMTVSVDVRPSVQLFAVTPFDRRFKMGTWVGSDFESLFGTPYDSLNGPSRTRRESARDILLEHLKKVCVGSYVEFEYCVWSRVDKLWVFRFVVVPDSGVRDKFAVCAYVHSF